MNLLNYFKNTAICRNILVLGSDGMLGHDVCEYFHNISMNSRSKIGKVVGLDIKDGYDFSKQNALDEFLKNKIKFDICVNCIAYTDTAKAETPDGYNRSYILNALVPKYLAESCRRHNIKLIHISTDYVFSEYTFNGENTDNVDHLAYYSTSVPFPVSVYGQHKLIGEQFIQNAFSGMANMFAILRTSWLYGNYNSKSFIHKFMRNVFKTLSNNGKNMEMTENEYSVPVSTWTVIQYIHDIISKQLYAGIFHAVPSNENREFISRFDYAKTVLNFFKSDMFLAKYPEYREFFDQISCDEFLIPVARNGHWPHESTMLPNYVPATVGNWKSELEVFLTKNGKQIISQIENDIC